LPASTRRDRVQRIATPAHPRKFAQSVAGGRPTAVATPGAGAFSRQGGAVDWLCAALGFVERVFIGENHRAQWTFSQTLADLAPEQWGGTTVTPG
jgi:hypothetical protein